MQRRAPVDLTAHHFFAPFPDLRDFYGVIRATRYHKRVPQH
jgi:hypothetical protein